MNFLKNINWKVRFKNKVWVIAFIGGLLLLTQTVLALFNIDFDYTTLNAQLINIVNAVFALLALIGISIDGTTEGWKDSQNALSYTIPGLNEDDVVDEDDEDEEEEDDEEEI